MRRTATRQVLDSSTRVRGRNLPKDHPRGGELFDFVAHHIDTSIVRSVQLQHEPSVLQSSVLQSSVLQRRQTRRTCMTICDMLCPYIFFAIARIVEVFPVPGGP